MPNSQLPTWAPRVKQHLIRRLYESDAQGMLDEELVNEVGWGLRGRCESFIIANAAAHGQAACPLCGALIPHHHRPDDLLRCEPCDWQLPWPDYFKTFQHKQLSGPDSIIEQFQQFVERFPSARDPREKMLLIDRLIHTFHWNAHYSIGTRAACVNLIEGRHFEVVNFLDNLTYGPGSTPGLEHNWEDWRGQVDLIADLWKDDRIRRKPRE